MKAGVTAALFFVLPFSGALAQEQSPWDGGSAEQLTPPPVTVEDSPRATDPEDVLSAVNRLFGEQAPPERARRIEELAKLSDERAGPTFAYVARNDGALSVRVAAARALGSVSSETFTSLASALALDPGALAEVRIAAMDALGSQQTRDASAALLKITASPEEPAAIRNAALGVLREKYPAIAVAAPEPPRATDRLAVAGMTVVGAASGAYSLGLVGSLSSNSGIGVPVGILGGLVIGGTAGLLLAQSAAVTGGDAGYLLSAAIWSVPVGWLLGNALATDGSGGCGTTCGVALATHLGAMGAAWLTREVLHPSIEDDVVINIGALSGLSISAGLLALAHSDDRQGGYALLAGGITTGFVGTAAFAKHVRLSAPMGGLLVVSAGELAFSGAMLGAGASSDSQTPTGLALIGAGVGAAGILAASPFWQPTVSDATLISFAALQGNLIGAGVPLAAIGSSGDSQSATHAGEVGTAIGGIAAAAAAGVLIRPLELRLDAGDTLLVALGTGVAAWEGLGWASIAEGQPALGTALAAMGVSSLGVVALSQRLDLTPVHVAALTSGAAWGAWLGGWTAYLFTDDASTAWNIRLGTALSGTLVGVGATALLLSPWVNVHPLSVTWVSVFGVGGMTLGSMAAVFIAWDSPGKPVATANVIGSVIGMTAGALLAPQLNRFVGAVAPVALDHLPARALPVATAAPLLDRSGHRVDGFSALLCWTL